MGNDLTLYLRVASKLRRQGVVPLTYTQLRPATPHLCSPTPPRQLPHPHCAYLMVGPASSCQKGMKTLRKLTSVLNLRIVTLWVDKRAVILSRLHVSFKKSRGNHEWSNSLMGLMGFLQTAAEEVNLSLWNEPLQNAGGGEETWQNVSPWKAVWYTEN